MIKLYGKTQSRTFRVLWMLEEMGQDYDHVDLLPHDPELCAIHPAGKVPVLVDGDVIVTDSTAILHYLADRYDARFTHPAGSARRAGQDSLVFLLLDEFDSCLWTAARHSFILPADYRVREVKRSLRWEFDRSVASLCSRVTLTPFLMGDRLTIPDFILMHCLLWSRTAKFPLTHPALLEYIRVMEARPAFRRVCALSGKTQT